MRERPILFSGAMVKAILAGTKTQTRRVIKPQPIVTNGWGEWGYKMGAPTSSSPRSCVWNVESWQKEQSTAPIDKYCPHGVPGDRLWLRETHFVAGTGAIFYRADGHELGPDYSWRPSIFMLRQSSRITLEITGVRAERLQEISEADAVAEGVISNDEYHDNAGSADLWPCPHCDGFQVYCAHSLAGAYEAECTYCDTAVKRYSQLWDSINGKKYPWASNPFCWVLEFKRL